MPSNRFAPNEADQAQAAVVAEDLAGLIGDCDARLAALEADADRAARYGALRAARITHNRVLQVRRELHELQGMEHRLIRRFFSTGRSQAAVPSAG